jgi:hypothetical protein
MITTLPPTLRPTLVAPAARPATSTRWWLGGGAALLVVLQIFALDERNPITRTLSSYEYTPWGWMFPLALAVFGVGVALLAVRLGPGAPFARLLLAGAALASWVTAAFPAGTGPTAGYWPGEVHRWGSIVLVVLGLAGALAAPLGDAARATRAAVVRLVTVGAVAGGLFLAGQTLKPAVPLVLGEAPLAGGLTQRVLVASVAAVLLLLAGVGRIPAARRAPAT